MRSESQSHKIDGSEPDKERHDQLSRDIRITGLILFCYSIFCFITLSQVDEIIKTRNVEIPLAEFPIKFSSFLTVGPIVLIIITFYLHLFIWEWKQVLTIRPEKKLPFTFNMENPPAKILSSLIFYVLPPLVLLFFSYRAYIWAIDLFDVWGMAALICFILLGVLWFIHIKNEPQNIIGIIKIPVFVKRWFVFGFMVIGCVLATMAITGRLNKMFPLDLVRSEISGQTIARLNLNNANFYAANIKETIFLETSLKGANLKEAHLEKADLQKVNLSGANCEYTKFEGANLKGANLNGADLRKANLDGVNLQFAKLVGANLSNASLIGAIIKGTNLKNVTNLTCDQLISAKVQNKISIGSKTKFTHLPNSLDIIWNEDGSLRDCY